MPLHSASPIHSERTSLLSVRFRNFVTPNVENNRVDDSQDS
ncbi:hypothetical protein T4B_13393, partial [Trichinella pseudospiralis]